MMFYCPAPVLYYRPTSQVEYQGLIWEYYFPKFLNIRKSGNIVF